MWPKIKPYIISIAIALGTGALAAFLTRNNMNIYDSINKPSLAPNPIIFPIVWTILYTLMGISSALICQQRKKHPELAADALLSYIIQLFLNFTWSLIFFNLQNYLFAFIWIVILWIIIFIMIIRFYKISPLAAYLQIPYLIWVTFAGYLNLTIFLINS